MVIAGKRGDTVSYAACVILATTRADVNGVVRRRLGAKKASFAPMDDAVALSGMEYGGITPIGLPADWPVLVDRAVLDRDDRRDRQRAAPVEDRAAAGSARRAARRGGHRRLAG